MPLSCKEDASLSFSVTVYLKTQILLSSLLFISNLSKLEAAIAPDNMAHTEAKTSSAIKLFTRRCKIK